MCCFVPWESRGGDLFDYTLYSSAIPSQRFLPDFPTGVAWSKHSPLYFARRWAFWYGSGLAARRRWLVGGMHAACCRTPLVLAILHLYIIIQELYILFLFIPVKNLLSINQTEGSTIPARPRLTSLIIIKNPRMMISN